MLKTDYQALQYIKTAYNYNSRILKTAFKPQGYDYEEIYIKREDSIAVFLVN